MRLQMSVRIRIYIRNRLLCVRTRMCICECRVLFNIHRFNKVKGRSIFVWLSRNMRAVASVLKASFIAIKCSFVHCLYSVKRKMKVRVDVFRYFTYSLPSFNRYFCISWAKECCLYTSVCVSVRMIVFISQSSIDNGEWTFWTFINKCLLLPLLRVHTHMCMNACFAVFFFLLFCFVNYILYKQIGCYCLRTYIEICTYALWITMESWKI